MMYYVLAYLAGCLTVAIPALIIGRILCKCVPFWR